MLSDTGWMGQAACKQRVVECEDRNCKHSDKTCIEVASVHDLHRLFFPEAEKGVSHGLMRQACEICFRCPVWKDCLKWASQTQESWQNGVYGGLKPSERKMKRGHKLVPDVEAAMQRYELKKERAYARLRRTKDSTKKSS